MEGLGAAASVIAVVELAAKVASLCLEYSSAVKHAKSDIERLRKHTDSLKITVNGAQKLLQGPDGARLETSLKLREAMANSYLQLDDIATKLEEKLRAGRTAKAMRCMGLRALRWPFESKDVDKIIANLQQDQTSFTTALQIDQIAEISDIRRKIDLPKLPVVTGAAFDAQTNEHDPKCHPDTRVDLLAEIDRWIEDTDAKCIFWLCGMAGTGKSTISRTVASRLSAKGVPVASFLFKAGDGDRGRAAKFFTTITSQLVNRLPLLAPHVRNAIESDPEIADKSKGEQFQKLILEPLNKCKDKPHIPALVLVVIDALDECDREEDAVAIIRILSKAKEANSVSLRFFVTSRPELPIRNGFGEIQGEYQDVALHRIPEPIVGHDISAFLRYELARIGDKYNSQAPKGLQLPPGWPSEDVIRILTQMAVPLFIFAATVCRFVEDSAWSDPANQLEKILQHQTKTNGSELDKLNTTYLPILNQLTAGRMDPQRSRLLNEFRGVVGPIVLLAQPLSMSSLARLLNISSTAIYGRLNSLHSVLDIPSQIDAPVRLFHLSFRDFLVDATKRAKEFWIDETQYHKTLADRCIQLLHQHLRRDICDLQIPGKLRSEVGQQTIDSGLPPEVQYACQYWVHHLKESKGSVQDGGPVHSFLKSHLLYWLEALGVLGRISESLGIVDDLLTLSPAGAIEISGFLRDIRRFVQSSQLIIDIAPLQVYASTLAFSPADSITRNLFKQEELRWITTGPVVEENWNACRQTLEGHSDGVWSVTFSPDSKLIASGSYDKTVKIWDVATGACTQTLEGHSHGVRSVTFSPDSKLIASGSYDKTVKIWDVATGACTQTFKGHSHRVRSVTFSPDSKLIASGSRDKTVKIWDVATGACTQTLEGHSHGVWSVTFSPDSKLIASGSYDKTVKIWDVATGACTQTLEGHSDGVQSVTFSPDSKLIASGSYDKTVKIWDVATGACTQTLEGHSDGVWSVTFSPDSKLIASGSYDKTVKIWDVATGACTQTLEGHSDGVQSVTFSPDSKLIASGSYDKTVKIWDVATGACTQTFEGHSDGVQSVTFSPDSKLIASRSYDKTVKIWDVATGACTRTLKGHNHWVQSVTHGVRSVTFSPDSKLIASGSIDKTVKIWDVATRACTQTLKGHSDGVQSVTFSPDSKLIASGSIDKTVKIWDVATGACTQTLEGHSHGVQSVTFSPDSKLIASGSWSADAKPPSHQNYHIGSDSRWIIKGSENWFWLPPGSRPICWAAWTSVIAIGSSSGRVLIMTFPTDK
ncbi:hypothetical protein B0T14DRAFT_542129 [Immersiella caudata]|uniref:Nephrocystin 3-like N-terminal domain-containing protein n=1 Tax=Immersiella caudata TaxID=314043 RepID=A0AA39XFC2_9PEZI|nr:hypothetical protein B0T14DRAFT_542129 [Immersiella caudata]